MDKPLLPLASSSWGLEEMDSIAEVLRSGYLSMGEKTRVFEEIFAKWVGRRHAIMVNSGSSANLLSVAGIRYGGVGRSLTAPEVIVPAVSWNTTYAPLDQLGFRIRLVDVDSETFNMSIDSLRQTINEHTVGIFGVNLLGNSSEWDEIAKLAEKHNLWILEDNCESMGAIYKNKLTGNNGLASTFSFFFSHHICTIEGGMVVTDDDNFAVVLRSLRAHGWSREAQDTKSFLGFDRGTAWEENFRFYLPGFNLRPTEISAAIGQVQIRKIDHIVEERRQNAEFFKELLKDSNTGWRLQKESHQSSWFTFGLVHQSNSQGSQIRQNLISLFERNGIQSRPIVAGNIARHPVTKSWTNFEPCDLPNADKIHYNGIMIGNHHFSIREQLERVLEILLKSEENYSS